MAKRRDELEITQLNCLPFGCIGAPRRHANRMDAFSYFNMFTQLLTLLWPVLSLAAVLAGIMFVRAVSSPYNWSFLIGSATQTIAGFAFPLSALLNLSSEWLSDYYIYISGLNLVAGILIAYGIIGHACSYSRLVALRNEAEIQSKPL